MKLQRVHARSRQLQLTLFIATYDTTDSATVLSKVFRCL